MFNGVTYTIPPDEGYIIKKVTVNGVDYTKNEFTLSQNYENAEIVASFTDESNRTNIFDERHTSVTFTKANSPYYMYIDITIPDGEKLSIESGVELFWGTHAGKNLTITVEGSLQALGNEDEPILVAAIDTSLGWGGFTINSKANNDSILFKHTYCSIQKHLS